ncbi:MAG: hypothetical protein FGM61_07135 [Sediminibacterium sp.]|nr:hypothetical protein [Sediminibacterium sp.]
MRIMILLMPLCLLAVASCTKPATTDEVTAHELEWKKAAIHQYTFVLRVNCFCPVAVVGPHTIKVVADTIASVNGAPYQPGSNGKLPTLPELFSFIRESDAKKPYQRKVQFNDVYGFPESIFYDFSQQIADEEIGYVVTDFTKN